MADSYNVSVTLDSFNGIITGNGDGTYNVTYTNLTSGQIDAIGAAIETKIQGNLKPVALSGNYNDLIGAPQLPDSALETVEHEPDEEHQEAWTSQEIKEFSDVAFSGKASDLDNDAGFLTNETNAYTDSVASEITEEDIENWNNKSEFDESTLASVALTGDYDNLNNKPNLDISSNETNISGFSIVARTGNYNDLSDKPFNFINLTYYNNTLATEQEKLKLQLLGEENTYILDINNYKHKDTNNSLIEDFQFYINDFYLNKKNLSFINYANACYNCFDITTHSSDNNINYYILSFFKTINNNYETIRSTTNFSENIAQSQLNNLNIQSLTIGNIIIDLDNNIIYCKLLDS